MLNLGEREERRQQLGASEIHKILNFDSQECQDMWEQKIGIQSYQDLDSDAITAGNILEEECLKYFENTNNITLVYNERISHKDIKKLVVSLDARTSEMSIPVENKVINECTWKRWAAKRSYNVIYGDIKLNIPNTYYCQIQTQIAVLNAEYGILNVNTLTDEEQEDPINVEITDLHNKQIKITRNDELIKELEKRAIYMLHCVEFKIRPSELDYLEKNVF